MITLKLLFAKIVYDIIKKSTTMEPILNKETEILIVGTFPGEKSRELNQYYADSRNQFWKLMGNVLDVNLQELDYNDRIETLQEYKIGLWDTIRSCKITGSSDRNIHDEECNDFSHLTHINKIVCNGMPAEKKYIKRCNVPDSIEIIVVPSSSTARTMRLSQKAEEWKKSINASRH